MAATGFRLQNTGQRGSGFPVSGLGFMGAGGFLCFPSVGVEQSSADFKSRCALNSNQNLPVAISSALWPKPVTSHFQHDLENDERMRGGCTKIVSSPIANSLP